MNFFSIVCEFNPFHTGHKYLIEQVKKKASAEGIVCIMSGSMVQRGDIAIYDKWTRAKAAIENGADLVVELPACYVLQSADIFAKGAVEIAHSMGSYGIAFGSECDDAELLWEIARNKNSESPIYSDAIKEALGRGMSYPASCEFALRKIIPNIPDEVFRPNATLVTAYMANLIRLNSPMKVHVEKRIGDYHNTKSQGEFASATSIRQKILSGDKTSPYSLCTSSNIYDINKLSAYILGFFRTADEKDLENISGMEEGLAKRLINQSKMCTNYAEFVSACVTKRYTAHRIGRVILCCILGITCAPEPQYARVLALNSKGAEIIKNIKARGNLEVITKVTKSSDEEMLKKDILATDIASLCVNGKASLDYTTSPYVKN